jgi:hypothetical protein
MAIKLFNVVSRFNLDIHGFLIQLLDFLGVTTGFSNVIKFMAAKFSHLPSDYCRTMIDFSKSTTKFRCNYICLYRVTRFPKNYDQIIYEKLHGNYRFVLRVLGFEVLRVQL